MTCLRRHLAVNACLAPLCSMHGLAVTTVEGIGSTKTKLHAVQVTCTLEDSVYKTNWLQRRGRRFVNFVVQFNL